MAQFILVFMILAALVFAAARYLLGKQKKDALEKLYKYYYELLSDFNALPGDLRDYLREYSKKFRMILKDIEGKYNSYRTEPDILGYVNIKRSQGENFKKQISEFRKKWELFDRFLTDVGYIKLNLENLQKDIRRKTQDILRSLEDKEEEKERSLSLKEKTEDVLKTLEKVYQDYDKMQGVSFNNFDEFELRDLQQRRDLAIEEAKRYYILLENYYKEISIILRSLQRKSSFYIKLKELLEGYPKGKNKMASLGEISVSFNTFERLEEGSRYRQDVFVSGKRIAEEITVSYLIKVGTEEWIFEDELAYDELIDLLFLCRLQPGTEENDENGIGYNFGFDDLNCLLAEKDKKELLVRYVKEEDFIKRIPLEI